MAVEGFAIIDQTSTTISSGQDAFASDITFSDTPENIGRELQIQIYAQLSSTLSLVYNGTNYPINNGVAIIGSVVFTILVTGADTLNITTDGTNIPLEIIVTGG